MSYHFSRFFTPSLPLVIHFTRLAHGVTSPFGRSPSPLSGWRHLWMALYCKLWDIVYITLHYFLLLGLCFRFVNEAKTFSDAQTFCNDDNGATFFVPTNKEAHDTIRTEANVQFSSTQSYWIGIADNADEGKFVFVDGDFINKEIKFKQWALNQPNNYGKGR